MCVGVCVCVCSSSVKKRHFEVVSLRVYEKLSSHLFRVPLFERVWVCVCVCSTSVTKRNMGWVMVQINLDQIHEFRLVFIFCFKVLCGVDMCVQSQEKSADVWQRVSEAFVAFNEDV